jgi:hypothetical protein
MYYVTALAYFLYLYYIEKPKLLGRGKITQITAQTFQGDFYFNFDIPIVSNPCGFPVPALEGFCIDRPALVYFSHHLLLFASQIYFSHRIFTFYVSK